jgi:hypothetical protein
MVDCRIDGNTYLERANKYKHFTCEENINSAMGRRNFVRNKMTVLLREYLYKRSLKEKTGRENIHYCNYAFAVKVLRRMSECETSPTPDPPESPSRLNPMAPSFVLRTVSDDSTMSPSRDSHYESENESPNLTKNAISPILRVNAIYNRGINRLRSEWFERRSTMQVQSAFQSHHR